MKRISTIALYLSLIAIYTIGCTSKSDEQIDLDFTGTFGITIQSGDDTSRTYTFVLTQDGEQITGKYAYLEYVSGSRLESLYDASGDVLLPGAAEIRLRLLQAFPPEFSPAQEITLNVSLKGHGDSLHVNEWNLDVPRIK